MLLLWKEQQDGEVETRLSFGVYGLAGCMAGGHCRHSVYHDIYIYIFCARNIDPLFNYNPQHILISPSCRFRISMGPLFRAGERKYAHQDHQSAPSKLRPKRAKELSLLPGLPLQQQRCRRTVYDSRTRGPYIFAHNSEQVPPPLNNVLVSETFRLQPDQIHIASTYLTCRVYSAKEHRTHDRQTQPASKQS